MQLLIALLFLSFANSSTVCQQKAEMDDDQRSIDLLLKRGLQMASKHTKNKSYTYNSDSLTVEWGMTFDRQRHHLMITIVAAYEYNVFIYLPTDTGFRRVLYNEETFNVFQGDTLQDVNGDGYKDYVVHWYPMSGCCFRDIYDVFQYDPKTGSFIEKKEFPNPVFDPKNKIVRGGDYGYGAPLYKFRWNGDRVDTLEFVWRNKGRYIIGKNKKRGRLVSKLPREYRNVTFSAPD
jgi:hypothetical protein